MDSMDEFYGIYGVPNGGGLLGGPNPVVFCGFGVGFCEIVRIGVPNGVPNWGYCTVSG